METDLNHVRVFNRRRVKLVDVMTFVSRFGNYGSFIPTDTDFDTETETDSMHSVQKSVNSGGSTDQKFFNFIEILGNFGSRLSSGNPGSAPCEYEH